MTTRNTDYNLLSPNELLELRHEVRLIWHEPWVACGPEGNEDVFAHVEMRATLHDCINLQRAVYKDTKEKRNWVPLAPGELIGKDYEFLLDFIAVHWAVFEDKNVGG